EDRPRFKEHMANVRSLDDHGMADFEHRMRDRTGQWRWFHSRDAVFSRDGEGRVREIIGTTKEFTARKHSEEALQTSERKLRAIFDGTFEYMGLLTPDGILMECNRASLEFAELRREDLVGR